MTSKKKRVFLSDLDFFRKKISENSPRNSKVLDVFDVSPGGRCGERHFSSNQGMFFTQVDMSLLVTSCHFSQFSQFSPHHVLCACSMLVLFFKNIILNIIMLYYFHSIFDVFLYSLSADLPILWSVPRFQFQWFHVRRCLPSWQRKAESTYQKAQKAPSKCRSSKYETHKCKYKWFINAMKWNASTQTMRKRVWARWSKSRNFLSAHLRRHVLLWLYRSFQRDVTI